MPVAGCSLRPSRPSLARCFLRFAILAARRKQRRLPGTGSPSLFSPVAQVVNLCVFPVRIIARMRFRKGEQPAGCEGPPAREDQVRHQLASGEPLGGEGDAGVERHGGLPAEDGLGA